MAYQVGTGAFAEDDGPLEWELVFAVTLPHLDAPSSAVAVAVIDDQVPDAIDVAREVIRRKRSG